MEYCGVKIWDPVCRNCCSRGKEAFLCRASEPTAFSLACTWACLFLLPPRSFSNNSKCQKRWANLDWWLVWKVHACLVLCGLVRCKKFWHGSCEGWCARRRFCCSSVVYTLQAVLAHGVSIATVFISKRTSMRAKHTVPSTDTPSGLASKACCRLRSCTHVPFPNGIYA